MMRTLFLAGVWIALATLATTLAAQPRPATIPVETFAEVPFFKSPVLSPDGQKLAGKAFVRGADGIIILDVDKGTPRFLSAGKVTILAMRWAGNATLLLTTSTTTKWIDGETVPVTRLVAFDIATGGIRLLDGRSRGLYAGDVLHVAPDGGSVIVASQDNVYTYPSVKRVDVATGKAETIERPREGVWSWFADGAGVVRAAVSYANGRWRMWYRDQPDAPLRLVKRNNGDDAGAVDGLRFLAGKDHGLIVTNSKTGRFAAYRYDLGTGTLGEAVFEHPVVDVTGVITDGDDGNVLGVSYTDDRYRVEWLDPELRALQGQLDRWLKNAENVIISTSRDANRVLLWSGSAANPGTYYVMDRKAKRLITINSPLESLTAAKLAKVEPITYTARDGLQIHGYLTLPADRGDKLLPLVVLPHGGPHSRDTWDFDRDVQFLASRGYAVLQTNFRGSTGYGKTFVERGYGQWGRAMQDDIDDGLDWLVKRGTVDPKRVCIMGSSYGGYAAVWGAIRNPDRYRCAVSLAGVTDIGAMLRYDRKAFSAPRYFREWQKKVEGEDKIDLATVSPVSQAARLKVPLLLAHGEKDTNVPPKQARALLTALKGNSAPVESVFYPEAGHGLSKREDMLDFYKRLDAFLVRHNPA